MSCERCAELQYRIEELKGEKGDLEAKVRTLEFDLQKEEGKCCFCEGAKYLGAEDEMWELRSIVFGVHNENDICTCTHCVTHRGER